MRTTSFRQFFLVLTTATMLSLAGCTPQVIKPPMSQLQIREMQTRTYDNRALLEAMKAVINALQDEGFIIKNADKELGFIQATKEVDVEDGGDRFMSSFLNGHQARWHKNNIIDCSANLTAFGKNTKIRLIFQSKTLDNFGNPVSINQIQDFKYYQDIFSKIDKSLFLEAQQLS